MILFYFESPDIVFRIHIMQIEITFSFQKYITRHSLISLLLYFDRLQTQFQYTCFCYSPKNLEKAMAVGLRNVKIVA